MPPTDEKTTLPIAEPEIARGVGRDAFLARAGKLKEEFVTVDGLGEVLCGELSGEDRALVIERQAEAMQEKRVAVRDYQRTLIQKGVLDPVSPLGNRTPLFRPADMDQVMRVGGGVISQLVSKIEELSGLGANANQRAEGNSDAASDSSTSE